MKALQSSTHVILFPLRFLQEVVSELKQVSWPSRSETLRSTIIVIGLSIFVGVYVAGLDFLASKALNTFIIR